jgi:ribonuclease Z
MSNVRITFLGTGAGMCIYRAHTAIVLDWANGTRVLLDAGSGNSVLQNGALLGILAQDFHQVLLTHQHGDHMGGLPHIQGQRTMLAPNASPLQVYASEEALERVQRLFWATSITHAVNQDGVTTSEGRKVVSWHPSQEDQWIDLQGSVRASSFPVDHIPGAVGWRVESEGVSVVFSGDTRFCPRLAEAAQGATVLIHEVLGTESDKEGTKRRGHSTAAEAARIATQAGVSELIITHIDSCFHFNSQPLIDEARRYFCGPISVASDLYQVTVGTE